jgi:hypothetical protein
MTEREIERVKACVEDVLSEYERAVKAFAAWLEDWRKRNAKAS